MKTLLLMRHAKSSWADPGMEDIDRPLNERGLRDAPRMGRWLSGQKLAPDVIVASSALRARQTAELVATAIGFSGKVREVAALYHASPSRWREVVQALPADADSALCVGHNPGLEELLLIMTGEDTRMPTAAVAHATLPVDAWREFTPDVTLTVHAVWRPKEIGDAEDE